MVGFIVLLLNLALFFHVSSGVREHPLVKCETTKGPLLIEVYTEWSPLGAERFLNLVTDGFFTNIALYRCVERFLVQFGISDNPIKKHWHRDEIPDDPNQHLGIKKNYVSFAGGGPNTRSTQIFIAFEDLDFLGHEPWETPFGKVIEGQDTLDNLYKGYGDMPPFGEGPDQSQIFQQGNAYVRSLYPKIDFLNTCSLIDSEPEAVEQEMHEEHSEFEPEDDDNGKPQEQGDVVNHDEVKKAVPDIAESADKEEEGSGDQAAAEEASETIEEEENENKIKNARSNLRSNFKKMPQLSSESQSLAIRALFVLGVAVIVLAVYSQRRSAQTTGGKSQ